MQEGRQIASSAFQALSSNLKQAIVVEGVSGALKFCNIEAMPLTESLSTHFGVELRRASHRPRNPSNQPDSLEMVTIRKYLQQLDLDNEPEPVVYADSRRIAFHAPIRISTGLCLNCHGRPGNEIATEDLKLIQSLYPQDEATGFEMGELRGIWSITFPRDHFTDNNR
ncbi:MAG: DUF3365 domain-containing protein [Balneolaceae bacterium]|nr:DUF3365 domain-containing protein [Balneolaceae bacterium]